MKIRTRWTMALGAWLFAASVWGCGNDGAPVVVELAIVPDAPTLNPGSMQMLTLLATYRGGRTRDVTGEATWTSHEPSIADVSNTDGSRGHVTASMVSGGRTVVTARLGGLAATTSITVSSAALRALSVPPGDKRVPVGHARRFVALGSYDDGSTRNVSTSLAWQSADPSVATVDSMGVVRGVAAGETSVRASFGLLEVHVPVTVIESTLTSIVLAPSNDPTLSPGKSTDFSAFGRFGEDTAEPSDDTVLDLTDAATWASATPEAATVTTRGQVTAVAQGSSDITASFGSVTSGTVTLDVVSGSTHYAERRIPFEFEDISFTGDLVTSGDDKTAPLPLIAGFLFDFFGTEYTTDQIHPNTNGLIRFGASTTSTGSSFPFPSGARPSIAAYFDDLVSAVYAQTFGNVGSRRLIVQWVGGFYSDPGAVVVQVVLYESTSYIDVRWLATGPQYGDQMVIGVQNEAGDAFTQHGDAEPVASSGTAIRFVP